MDHSTAAALAAPRPGMHALHGAAHGHGEEPTTGIPHDKMGMWVFLCSEVMFFTGLIGSYIVLRFGTPEQRQRAARDARAGELFGVWNTEEAPGVRLTHDGEGSVLSGHKTFASGAGHVTRALCPAEADGGRVMVLLPGAPAPERFDPSFWQPAGMRATVSERVDLGAREVHVRVDLHAGDATATVWTNDLTHEYVTENSAYSS